MKISFCCVVFIVSILFNILMATQLHQAVFDNDLDAAKQILDKYPCLVNASDVAYGGWPSLHFAAFYGKLNMVKLLVERKANPDITDIVGKKAIDYARDKNHAKVVAYLFRFENS